MLRKIVRIDAATCNGCGQCVTACAEGALKIVNGKATLVSESYCDGLGACLGKCPMDAIIIEEREVAAFDEGAAHEHVHAAASHTGGAGHFAGGCPGSATRTFERAPAGTATVSAGESESQLSTWPVQLKLVPPTAGFLHGADILVSADCVPFALADFHARYLAGKALLVGCPKLDDLKYYADKLTAIMRTAQPRSLTVLRMEVPCCAGIAAAVVTARDSASPGVPVAVKTIGIGGSVVREELL